MAAHKQTRLAQPARKQVQVYLLKHPDLFGTPDGRERRLACGDGVMAISGYEGIKLALADHGVDLKDQQLLQRFNAMVLGYGFEKAENREAHVCAEAHLWMTLDELHWRSTQGGLPPRHRHLHPRHLDAWVFEIDGKNRPKEDSPCKNCRQWVRREFLRVNGTS